LGRWGDFLTPLWSWGPATPGIHWGKKTEDEEKDAHVWGSGGKEWWWGPKAGKEEIE